MTTTATWKITDYSDFNYLDSDLSGLRFSQGLVWNGDAGEWVSTWQYGMARLSSDLQFLQTTGTVDSSLSPVTAIPQSLVDMGMSHIGDIDYYDGKLYVSLDNEEGDYNDGHIAIFNASDLSYTGTVYELVGSSANPHHDVASWVAVDGAAGLGYGKEWQNGNTINVYNLSDWSFKETLTMDTNLKSIQGAKVLDGMMYMASDNNTRSVYSLDLSTGHVEELFELPEGTNVDTEVEGIEARKNADGNVELTVELIIDPKGDSYGDTYTRLFTYTLDTTTNTDIPLHHTWTVNTAADDNNPNNLALSLREALSKAGSGDTIVFDSKLAGKTITLNSELVLSQDITINGDINGDGKSDITIDRSGADTTIHVVAGTATLNGLVVTHGDDATASSIAVDPAGNLVFTNGATMTIGTDANDTINGTSHWDAIQGGAGADLIRGNGGNDLIDGGLGADMMIGGKGDDSYNVDNRNDKVTEAAGEGSDTVHTALNNYGLAANVENLVLEGKGDLKALGNDLDNTITGNDGNNYILAGSGNDVLFAGKGDDWLDGGTGADTFHGSAGDDTYVVDNKGDSLVDEAVGGGTDQVWSSISLNLGKFAGIDNLRLSGTANIDATGNALDNLITGNAGDNDIAGGLGNDRLAGKGGSDVFHFSDFGAANADWINDFDSEDAIALDGDVFTGLARASGHLAAADFVRGAAATIAGEAAVIYNANTGMLSYDHDGKGGDAAQDIAFIGKRLDTFDHTDILVL